MFSISRLEMKIAYTAIGCKSDDATASIATHHPPGTIRIEIYHTEIIIIRFLQKHQTIRPDTISAITYILNFKTMLISFIVPEFQNTVLMYDGSVPVVGDKKIIPSALIFMKNHINQSFRHFIYLLGKKAGKDFHTSFNLLGRHE